MENNKAVDANIQANKLPFSVSIVFQTTKMVNAPNNAGKNLIQKTEFPNCKINQEIQEVKGGTE